MVYKGMDYLKKQLIRKQSRIRLRYKYYEMKNAVKDFKIAIPNEFKNVSETLGWCAKAVDSVADRIVFREFENDNFNFNEIFNMNNKDILIDSLILGSLITSCNFVYISKDEDGFPRLQSIDSYDATGIIDPITNMMTEGYAVLARDASTNNPTIEAYFTCEETIVIDSINNTSKEVKNAARYCLLVPIIYRPDVKRPFGHSRISRSCMNLQQSALRTLRRSEIASEFYSYPQKYVLGTSADAEPLDSFKSAISTMLEITKDDEGDKPTVGQFNQQSMGPHIDQLKMFASLFAGETGLTLDDLGFVTENPSSAEAIKAAHENLRMTVRKAQKNIATGLINVGYLASCVRDNQPYYRNMIYETKVKYEPIFEPDMSTLSLIGDGAIKVNQAVPGYFNKDNLLDLTGIKPSDLPIQKNEVINE